MDSRQKQFFVLCLTLFFPLSALALEETSALKAIKAGRLVDVDGARVLKDQVIIVDGNTIKAVGENVPIPSRAKLIDLSRFCVLPGLIDCHTHITDPAELDPLVELQKTSAEKALQAVPSAKRTLEAGFTTIRDVGCYRALVDIALRNAINRQDIVGPRIFAAGAYLTSTGGGGALSGFAADIILPADLQFGRCDSPWQGRARVRDLFHHGADFIKLIATGAVLTHGSNPNVVEFSPEEMAAICDEAKRFGLKVAAHAHSSQGIIAAVQAGASSIEHGTFLDDEGIRLMKERGTYLVADIYNDDYIEAKGSGTPADFLKQNENVGLSQRKGFAKAVAAGVKVAFGTDAGVFPHGLNARQFPYMVRFGMTPMQAIQSATINAADLLDKKDKLGSLAKAKFADIIAVDGDPIQDPSCLEKVVFVMKDGEVFVNKTSSK